MVMQDGLTIFFIRHGETDWNAELRYQGQHEVPLNENGRDQAKRNGEALRAMLPSIAQMEFIASPLGRAVETMTIVRRSLGLDPNAFQTDDRLKEVHYGYWQGVLQSDVMILDPVGWGARCRDPYSWRPKGGESYADLMARSTAWLASVERDCVVVSHGGVGRTLRGHILGLEHAQVPELPTPQDRVMVLRNGQVGWL